MLRHLNKDIGNVIDQKSSPSPAAKKALMRDFERKLKQAAADKKEKLRLALLAAREDPPPPYDYAVPDPRKIPFPTIKVTDSTRQIKTIDEMLQEKRNKALVFDQ